MQIKREPNGRHQRKRARDGPTSELEIKRLAAVEGGDVTLSTSPLDRLFATAQINQDEYNVAEEYARCHRIRYGAGYPTFREAGRSPSEKQQIRAREFVDAATKILLSVSRESKNAVDDVVCYQKSIKPKSAFFRGIRALSKWYRQGN